MGLGECALTAVVITVELLANAWPDVKALVGRNYAEAGHAIVGKFEPDIEAYLRMENQGIAELWTARHDGKLVGYAMYLVVPHFQYKGKVWAMQDVLYVLPQYRGRTSIRMIVLADEVHKSQGVDVSYRHVSKWVDYSRTLERLGYTEAERGFMKVL